MSTAQFLMDRDHKHVCKYSKIALFTLLNFSLPVIKSSMKRRGRRSREKGRGREREREEGREGERELAQIFISPYSVSIPFRPPAGGLEGALAVGPGWVPHRHLCLHPPPSETPLPAGSHSGWAR